MKTNISRAGSAPATSNDRAPAASGSAVVSSHTPGPWSVEPADGGDASVGLSGTPAVIFTSIPNDDRYRHLDIAIVHPTTYGNDEDGHALCYGDADANANLIGAAPELLECLKAAAALVYILSQQAWLDQSQKQAAADVAEASFAVIVKAEGR